MLADRIGVMSARPGRIIDVVETHWPRERDSRIVERPEFGAITARLWHTLRGESMKTIGATGSRRRHRREPASPGTACSSSAAPSRCSRCCASPASSTRSRCRRRT